MKIAFYAPLKSPRHPNPSGDRFMARLLMSVLRETGREVELASEYRAWEGAGNVKRQQRLREVGVKLSHRLIRRYLTHNQPPDLWFTYHVYHKAPDWIGPAISDALKIPYIVAEASYAPKQARGPWQIGHDQCQLGIRRANAVVSFNDRDLPCLRTIVSPSCQLVNLKPFLPLARLQTAVSARTKIAERWAIPPDVPWLVCVAMLRPGDKLASFTQLSETLKQLVDTQWHLLIIGDGKMRHQVEQLFTPIRQRVTMLGLLDPDAIYEILKSSDVYVWPAVNEAYGMSLLEAQACGLPVVAAAVGGVAQIVEHKKTGYLAAANDLTALANYIRHLICDSNLRQRMGVEAEAKCHREHDAAHATDVLDNVIKQLSNAR